MEYISIKSQFKLNSSFKILPPVYTVRKQKHNIICTQPNVQCTTYSDYLLLSYLNSHNIFCYLVLIFLLYNNSLTAAPCMKQNHHFMNKVYKETLLTREYNYRVLVPYTVHLFLPYKYMRKVKETDLSHGLQIKN